MPVTIGNTGTDPARGADSAAPTTAAGSSNRIERFAERYARDEDLGLIRCHPSHLAFRPIELDLARLRSHPEQYTT
jgi:hypothetical protein